MDSNTSIAMLSYCEDEDDFDIVRFMQDQREIVNELLLKRSQVQQLRKDLDEADIKIFELTRKLEESNRVKTDQECLSKRVKGLEDKLRERKDVNAHLNESLSFEINTLKDKLEKAHVENKSLLRTIEDLHMQHQNDVIYRKDLIEEDTKIRNIITRCTESVEKLENDSKLLETLNAMQLCEKQQKTIAFFKNKNKVLEEEKRSIENEFIKCKAKLETLESLTDSYPICQKNSSIFYDETTKIIENLRNEVKDQQEQVKIFAAKLKDEMEANAQFVERDAATTLEIQNLNQKLAKFNPSVTDVSVQTDVAEGGSKLMTEIKADLDVTIIS